MGPPRVLVSIQYYLPGFKGGGTIRSLANLVDHLGDELSFRILTGDRDLRERLPYVGVRPGIWIPVGKAHVRYLRPREWWPVALTRIIRNTPHDLLYLSSCFAPRASICPLILSRIGAISKKPIILGPRGEFSRGAMRIRWRKKRLFLWLAKRFGLFQNVIWQASTELEEEDIRREIGNDATIVTARDCSPDYSAWSRFSSAPKIAGSARMCFVSRIAPKKHLLYAIQLLAQVSGRVQFDIIGPIDSETYWKECLRAIGRLPSTITVSYKGAVRYEELPVILASYDLFVFPTRGENFGHSILESLAAGCPVLVSDETPWRGLAAKQVGWDLPLADESRFVQALQTLIDMGAGEHAEMRKRAVGYALTQAGSAEAIGQNRAMFMDAISSEHGRSGTRMV